MTENIINDADRRMNKSMEALKHELAKIRTGRAHPSLLEHVNVNYYGSEVPLNQTASISVLDSHTLSITAWDKNTIPDIEKAILNSDLGLNPVTTGEVMRIPLPPLTEERRKELIRVVRSEAEKAKVAIRNIRRDAIHSFKNLIKGKSISEDDERKGEERVQKITDDHITQIDKTTEQKEKEMMEI
jgi:ribosome recycling factor